MSGLHETITTAARRIAREHNRACGSNLAGGKLVFDPDGHGGEFYTAGAYGFGPESVVVRVGWGPISQAEAQAILDEGHRRVQSTKGEPCSSSR